MRHHLLGLLWQVNETGVHKRCLLLPEVVLGLRLKMKTCILGASVGARVTPSASRSLLPALAEWKALVPSLQTQPWLVGPFEFRGLTLTSPPCFARKEIGVYTGKDPTRANFGVQRTQEKDISRNFLLPQK